MIEAGRLLQPVSIGALNIMTLGDHAGTKRKISGLDWQIDVAD